MEKLRVDEICEMIAAIQFRIFCLPTFYI